MATTKTDSKPAEPVSHAFVLDDAALATLESKGGRKPTPSVFLEELKDAMITGKAMGIAVTETRKPAYIMAQLRKGAKSLDIKVKIWDRGESLPNPFVGFQVIPTESTVESK